MLAGVQIPYTSEPDVEPPMAPTDTSAMDEFLSQPADDSPPPLLARPADTDAMDAFLKDDLAKQATQELIKYRQDPEKYHKTPEQLVQLNLAAQNGKGFLQRAGEKALGAFGGAGQAWDGLKKSVGDSVSKAYNEPATLAGAGAAIRDTAVGAFQGVQQAVPLAYDLVNAGVQASPIITGAEYLAPKAAQKVEAGMNAGSDLIHGGVNSASKAEDAVTGHDPSSIYSGLGEQAGMLALGGPEGLSLAEKAPALADTAVNAAQKYGNAAVGVIANKTADAVPAVATAAAVAAMPHASLGHVMFEIGGAAIAGRTGVVKHALNTVIQAPLRDFAAEANAVAAAPEGLSRIEALQSTLRTQAQDSLNEASALGKHLSEKDAQLLAETKADGVTPLFDSSSDALSKQAQQVRARQEQAQTIQDKIEALDGSVNTSKVLQDFGKLGTSLGITTGEGAAIGGGIAGASTPVGDNDTSGGALMGAGFGLLGGAASYKGGYNALKMDKAAEAGSQFLPQDHPDYAMHQDSMSQMHPEMAKQVNAVQGMVAPLDTKVVVLSPEEALARSTPANPDGTMPPTEGRTAPNGWFDKDSNTIYLNRDAVGSGVAGHELSHPIQQAIGNAVVNGTDGGPKMAALRQQFNDLYTQALNRTKVSGSLSEQEINDEAMAELGRKIINEKGIGAFYGGKSGGKIISEALSDGVNKLLGRDPDAQTQTFGSFEAPSTKGQERKMSDTLYDLGSGRLASASIPDSAVPSPESPKSAPTGTTESPAAIPADVAAKLKKQGFTDEQIAKLSPEDIVKHGNGPSFMPSSHPNAITDAAIRLKDGEIFKGIIHDDAYRAAEEAGRGDDILESEDGFVTRNGKFLSRSEALDHATKIGQIDRSAYLSRNKGFDNGMDDSGELEGGAFDNQRKFMPQSAAPIDGPAIEADGMIFKGDSHFAARKAALDYGIDPRKVKNAKELFTTRSGETLSPTEARERGESTGQLPKSLKDALTPEDLAKERKFMPAFTHYSNKEGAIEAGLAPWETDFHKLLKKEDKVGYDGLSPEEQQLSEEYHKKAEQQSGSFDNWYKESGGRQKNAENLFDDVKHMPAEEEGKKLGLAYIGKSEGKGYELHQFNDPETGSTISVKSTAPEGTLADKLADTRARFAGSQYMPASEKYLTPEEQDKMTPKMHKVVNDILDTLPSKEDMGDTALAGQAKRGWYQKSAQALVDIFGQDSDRFAALLAALSPQTSVESNLRNALNVWSAWNKEGRPTDRASVLKIAGENVEGAGNGKSSMLPAWENNTVRALSHEDPRNLELSGPKVTSFAKNLRGNLHEVTNDTWMANYAMVDQTMFAGRTNAKTKMGEKGAGYLAMNARTRETADYLTKLTGEQWTPAEVQETVWSFAKTLLELREKEGETRTAPEILKSGDLTDEKIGATPDFSLLLKNNEEYRNILEKSGYGDALKQIDSQPTSETVPAPREAGPGAGLAAARLENLKAFRERKSELKAAVSEAEQLAQAKPSQRATKRLADAKLELKLHQSELRGVNTKDFTNPFMPADAPERIPFKRFYGKKNGDIIDRLTGKKIDNVDEEDMDTMGDMIDEMNKEEPPLPPNWTGSHPDAFIPSLVGQRKDGTWGIYGPGKDLPLQGDFKSQEEALDALRDVHKQIYAPSVAKLPQGRLSHLALPE